MDHVFHRLREMSFDFFHRSVFSVTQQVSPFLCQLAGTIQLTCVPPSSNRSTRNEPPIIPAR